MMKSMWQRVILDSAISRLSLPKLIRGFIYCGGSPVSSRLVAQGLCASNVVSGIQSTRRKTVLTCIETSVKAGIVLRHGDLICLPEWGDDQQVVVPQATDFRIRLALIWMHMNLTERFALSRVAEVARISGSRLQHLFKADLHVSPLRYLKRARMTAAKALLLDHFWNRFR
jgi:hypothetical protein